MPCLSREQLEQIADGVIHQYKAALVPEKHLCYNVDPTELASLLGYTVDYQYLTKDGSVLGKTASGKMWITVYDSDKTEILYELDDRTILIEKRLLFSPRNAGRKNFTVAHELAHQIINRSFPEQYGVECRVFCDYRRCVKPRKKVVDWHEWQADALAAALLLPLDAITDATLTVQYILTNEKYMGDTLFQKTFKTDTLPFTKHKNNGELDQYYASESHEAIISREDFLAVAALMAEKSEYYGRQRPTSPYPLTKKLRCSRCGAFYIRRTGKGYTIWSCHNHVRSKELCDSKRYSETQIYGAFMRMFNKLYYNSKSILRNTLYQLDFVMTYKKKNNQQAVELNQSIVQLLEKRHMIEQLRSKGYLPDNLFLSQCRDIDKQLQALRTEKEILFDTQLESTYAEVKRLSTIVEDYGQEMTSFDEDIFDAIIKSITITPDGIIEFTLMGDLHFSERL